MNNRSVCILFNISYHSEIFGREGFLFCCIILVAKLEGVEKSLFNWSFCLFSTQLMNLSVSERAKLYCEQKTILVNEYKANQVLTKE